MYPPPPKPIDATLPHLHSPSPSAKCGDGEDRLGGALSAGTLAMVVALRHNSANIQSR